MSQRCEGRKRHTREPCRQWAVPGRRWCKHHGGKNGPPKTAEGMARWRAAQMEGNKRWFARMWALKEAGLIERFPHGRQKGWNLRTEKPAPQVRSRKDRPVAESPPADIAYDAPTAMHAVAVLRAALLG